MSEWTSPEFLARARAWIAERATVTGEIEQPHDEWWSTVLRVPTSEGTLWFKAVSMPEHAFEVPLTALLARLQPDRVPALVAVDVERGWLLMRDGGTRLREAGASVEHWERVLPECAEVQIALAPHRPELLAMGVPNEELATLPLRVEAILERPDALLLDQPEGLTAAERDRALAALPELDAMCRELAGYGIPETIQHDDLHDGNVFVDGDRHRIFDWGDACVSHPFHTLTVALRAAAWKLDLEPGGADVLGLRDAYLEPFAPYGTREKLRAAAELAYRTGTLARAHAWHRYVLSQPPDADPEDAESVPYGVKKFLERGPLGAWR